MLLFSVAVFNVPIEKTIDVCFVWNASHIYAEKEHLIMLSLFSISHRNCDNAMREMLKMSLMPARRHLQP